MEVGAMLAAARGDDRFVTISRSLADALATAQSSRNIPGGLLVVFDGTVGEPSRKFFAIMKAELHAGFIKTPDLRAEFVSDLFLSPKTKLYKIGIFISDGQRPRPDLPDGWHPVVYDSQMTASQRDSAATYFHSTFLGLSLPENAAQRVKQFYQKTKDFIRNSDLAGDEKVDLINGLYSYLKVDRARTIQVSRFAEQFMNDDLADDYRRHMRRERFPQTAIEKDLSEISGSLRSRRLRFPRSITLSGPSEAINELVTVTSGRDEDGAQTTQITIRGEIESQD